jgi:hypothetical protein
MKAEIADRFGHAVREWVHMMPREQAAQRHCGLQSVAYCSEIPRSSSAKGQPREGSLHVGTTAQFPTNPTPQISIVDQKLHRPEAAIDSSWIGQRRSEAGCKKAAAGAGYRAVDRVDETPLTSAGQRLNKFEIASGRRIDLHDFAYADAP